MIRARALRMDESGRDAAMNTWQLMALHAMAAATFIFLVQRYSMNASLETALMWALAFGGCAAGLAYSQSKR
jgi:hypothetical protein